MIRYCKVHGARWLRRSCAAQISVITLVWFLGDLVTRSLDFPFPGAVLGLSAVLFLLVQGTLRLNTLRRGANWLLAEMILFFIPVLMALIDHGEFAGMLGLKLFAVIAVGTVVVMVVTALTVEGVVRVTTSRHVSSSRRLGG